ncbi:MAG: hypothetical protein RIC95_14325 [Vicingaceae bacterium]
MKIFKISIFFVFALALIACGGNSTSNNSTEAKEGKQTASEEKANYSNMKQLDLAEYNVPAFIYVLNESKGRQKIEETAYGSVQIEVGDRFGIEIVPFGLSLAEFKDELENDMVYQIESIEEGENYFIYKKTIANSGTEAEYHFFLSTELEGDLYEVKSMNEKEFGKGAIEQMLNSAKSLSSKANT